MVQRTQRSDKLRLREILDLLMTPWNEPEMDHLSIETKLWCSMNPDEFPIYRRKILKPMPVKGLWWLYESQWLRFLSNNYQDVIVIKTNMDPDRVLTQRSFEPRGYCYIREMGDRVDIEAVSGISKWCPKKKKSLGTTREWLTVSITKETYEALDMFLGPRDDGCRHLTKDD